MRACGADSCGSWSSVRYVDVGRQRQDWNGDGFGDLAVKTGAGLSVYYGAEVLDLDPDWSLNDPDVDLGRNVTWVGDVNGDGFGDLAFVSLLISLLAPQDSPRSAIHVLGDAPTGQLLRRFLMSVPGDAFHRSIGPVTSMEMVLAI